MVYIAACPACGHHLAELGSMPRLYHPLHCANKDCPRPNAALEILSEPQRTDHLVSLGRDGGFSVKHPLIERLDDKLLHCHLADYVAEFGEQWLIDPVRETGWLEPGVTYRMWDEGGVSHTPEGDDYDYGVLWPSDDDGNAIPFSEEGK